MSGIRKLVRKVVDAVNVLCGNRRDDSMVKLIFNWTENYDRWEHEIHSDFLSAEDTAQPTYSENLSVFFTTHHEGHNLVVRLLLLRAL